MPHIADRTLFEAVTAPALGELAAAATGAEWVQVFWVQQLMKPPAGPTGAVQANVGWHQDRQYWKCWEDDSEVFTAWLALSDVPEEAGAMRFVPGSHQWGLLDQGDFFGQSPDAQRDEMSLPPGAQWHEEPVTLPAGGVSFHHNLTFHASGPNRASHTRLSFAVHLRTEKSAPLEGNTDELIQYLDRPEYCPVIFGG
jgi:ectoine hydroxylase-related dioxygenase (phytanoyl-CoA dioxygenase family)